MAMRVLLVLARTIGNRTSKKESVGKVNDAINNKVATSVAVATSMSGRAIKVTITKGSVGKVNNAIHNKVATSVAMAASKSGRAIEATITNVSR